MTTISFQSTRPIRGATCPMRSAWTPLLTFQSTRPIRGATKSTLPRGRGRPHFNPRAPYGARPGAARPRKDIGIISIHAPHTGRDQLSDDHYHRPFAFQSTRPIRGATTYSSQRDLLVPISIHAPHTGRDATVAGYEIACGGFQSTRPIRGATSNSRKSGGSSGISIHAPHTGRDLPYVYRQIRRHDFNPRAPYGARLLRSVGSLRNRNFNPRAPYGARQSLIR